MSIPRTTATPRIIVRNPESIFQVNGPIVKGTFRGRWHFTFGKNYDPEYMHFGALRVFNDDTLSPGAIWPLHPHEEIEVVTYCAEGEFRHEDERGKGGILKEGWVQHTTVGRGMFHSEINNSADAPMRFIQMWFIPSEKGLDPTVDQKPVEKPERTDRFLPLVSNAHPDALPIRSDGAVYSCFLTAGHHVAHTLAADRGVYFYVLEGGPVDVNGYTIPLLGAAQCIGKMEIRVTAERDAELLLVDVGL